MSSVLEAEVLVHLDAQIASASKLLGLILAQGTAIRGRDVETVLARLADVQSEMGRRAQLEQERTRLLQSAGAALGISPAAVTLEHLCSLVTPGGARAALERSAALRGLLAEIAREHGINRALMRQELAFLAHLVRLVGQEPEPGYGTGGRISSPGEPAPRAAALHNVLDLQA